MDLLNVTLSINDSAEVSSVNMLSVAFIYWYEDLFYTECCCIEWHIVTMTSVEVLTDSDLKFDLRISYL